MEIVGDLFRHRAVGPAWKAAVHIALIDRRRARARPEGRVIHRRHDDDSAHNISRVERTSEFVKRQRALILVSVIAARQECRRSLAVADDTNRDHHRTPGGVVAAVGQAEKAVLDAVTLEVDGRRDRRWAQNRHGPQPFTNSLRGTFARHSTPVSVTRIDSVISSPISSSQRPVMKWNVMPGLSSVRSPGRKLMVRSPQSGGYERPIGYPVRLSLMMPCFFSTAKNALAM